MSRRVLVVTAERSRKHLNLTVVTVSERIVFYFYI
uniref:Uncharacterized protein n=1 Tax=Arundo donax TaxID=35708 RepID=A0A0A9E7Z0_ARUDO